jgi:hypothetical protein
MSPEPAAQPAPPNASRALGLALHDAARDDLLAGVYRRDEALGAALRARLHARLEGGGATEGVRGREGNRLPDQVPDGKAPACVPTHDQRAGTDPLSLADTADWRDDGGAAEGGAAVVGSGRSLSDAGLVAGGVRCRGEGARSAAGVDTGTGRRCRGRSPAPAGPRPTAGSPQCGGSGLLHSVGLRAVGVPKPAPPPTPAPAPEPPPGRRRPRNPATAPAHTPPRSPPPPRRRSPP